MLSLSQPRNFDMMMFRLKGTVVKTLTAKDAKQNFGEAIDVAQREPVLITRDDRPVGMLIGMDDLEWLLRPSIEAAIDRGLDDVAAGRVTLLQKDNVQNVLERIRSGRPL